LLHLISDKAGMYRIVHASGIKIINSHHNDPQILFFLS
jgi:hypothetical protein